MIDATPEQLQFIAKIIRATFGDDLTLYAYGSRVKDKTHRTSDLDVMINGPAKLDLIKIMEVRDMLGESSLPFRVDINDLATTDPSFLRLVEPSFVPFG